MWERYLSKSKIAECGYEAWEFGPLPTSLPLS